MKKQYFIILGLSFVFAWLVNLSLTPSPAAAMCAAPAVEFNGQWNVMFGKGGYLDFRSSGRDYCGSEKIMNLGGTAEVTMSSGGSDYVKWGQYQLGKSNLNFTATILPSGLLRLKVAIRVPYKSTQYHTLYYYRQ